MSNFTKRTVPASGGQCIICHKPADKTTWYGEQIFLHYCKDHTSADYNKIAGKAMKESEYRLLFGGK